MGLDVAIVGLESIIAMVVGELNGGVFHVPKVVMSFLEEERKGMN